MDIYWFLMIFLPYVLVGFIGPNTLLLILAFLYSMVISFIYCFNLAKKFDKGLGVTFGLLFLEPIFLAILAFDNDCIYNK